MLRFRALVIAALLAGTAAGLLGCASGGSQGNAVQWMMENEAEKKRLNDAGFPQYTGPM